MRAWFAGQHPQLPVPAILCELFSEHFGYLVAPEAIGLRSEADTNVGLAYQPSLGATVAAVADLGGNDVHLTSGHVDLDTAVHHAHRALDLAVTVTSSRCTQAITDLHARIQPFHTVTVARDFDERARLTLAASH